MSQDETASTAEKPVTKAYFGLLVDVPNMGAWLANYKAAVAEENPQDCAQVVIRINGEEVRMTLSEFVGRVFFNQKEATREDSQS
jgi:hypothetical protein